MTEFRSGFVCFVGRPNTGKSTLTNALVGSKVAITSSRPQTTRHTIRGIVHREDFQIILVDTPGLHRPRTLLGKRLNDLVRDTYSEVDAIGLCIPADEAIGPGDRWIVEQIRSTAPRTTLLAVVTKIDKVPKDRLAAQLVAVSDLVGDAAILEGDERQFFVAPVVLDQENDFAHAWLPFAAPPRLNRIVAPRSICPSAQMRPPWR